MRNGKIFPETLLELILKELNRSDKFEYICGIQPFQMKYGDTHYYIYVKNLSSAYFKDRPDTTRAQLPIKEEFDEIKNSLSRFIFLGYDYSNDVLVCWNYNVVKARLNEKKSVSFYSRKAFQEKVSDGEFLRLKLKNGDEPILFKRTSLIEFFEKIEEFFIDVSSDENTKASNILSTQDGKILKIEDEELLEKLRPLLKLSSPHTLEAISVAEQHYKGKYPKMKMRDWLALIKRI